MIKKKSLKKTAVKEQHKERICTERKLIINPEYLDLVPRPTPQEYRLLEQDILQKGHAHTPIIINQNNVILDGHTRYKICTKHKLPFTTETKTFNSPLEEKMFIIDSNLLRRQLTTFQIVELNLRKAPFIAELARKQQGTRTDLSSSRNLEKDEPFTPIHTDKMLAKMSGKSHDTVSRVRKILANGTAEEIQEARSRERLINRVYNKMKRRLNLEEAHNLGSPPMPEGVYDIIYADPPWRYDSEASQRGKADNHYATMTTEEICDVVIPSAENAMIFLWVTNPMLPEGFKVLKAWGFEYKTNYAWDKGKIGTGWYLRNQHELLLMGIKGKMPPPKEKTRFSSVISEPRGKHSAKPQVVYDMIEEMYPKRRYLELFSRNKRPGWTMWGLEAPEQETEPALEHDSNNALAMEEPNGLIKKKEFRAENKEEDTSDDEEFWKLFNLK